MSPEEEPLNEYEVLARERLEKILGVRLDRVNPGAQGRRHDFEAVQRSGRVVAVEVTSRLDDGRRKQLSAISDRLSSFALPGSSKLWMVNLLPTAEISKVRREEVRQLLLDLEAEGRSRAHHRQDCRDQFTQRLRDLRIAAAYSFNSRKGGRVVVGQDTYGGRGWYGAATDSWLAGFLASERGQRKVRKLNAVANASQRHLAIVLDPTCPEGIGIPLGLSDRDEPGVAGQVMPSYVPPARLTHLWLFPVVETWEGLSWAGAEGWAVVPPLRPPCAAS